MNRERYMRGMIGLTFAIYGAAVLWALIARATA